VGSAQGENEQHHEANCEAEVGDPVDPSDTGVCFFNKPPYRFLFKGVFRLRTGNLAMNEFDDGAYKENHRSSINQGMTRESDPDEIRRKRKQEGKNSSAESQRPSPVIVGH
jgi:hypothetical protein